MANFLDDNIVSLVTQMKGRYRLGLPIMAPTEDERPLRTEEVANRDLDLGLYDHPVVLTLIASKDPLGATALAASSRLVAAAHQRKIAQALTALAAEMTLHEDVRKGMGIAQRYAFAPTVADRLGEIALKRVEGERMRSFHSLVDLLKQLAQGTAVPDNFLYELLRLGYASDLRRDTLKSMMVAVFGVPALRQRILPTLGEALPFFPRDLLIAVASEINHAPPDPEQASIRREMQQALIGGERARQASAAPRPAERKPEIRPWMPLIQKAAQIRARRAF